MTDKVVTGLDEKKRCCTVCDAKNKCHVCGAQSLYACSDCRIDFGVSIFVCPTRQCRNEHELKCSASLVRERDALREALEFYAKPDNLEQFVETASNDFKDTAWGELNPAISDRATAALSKGEQNNGN